MGNKHTGLINQINTQTHLYKQAQVCSRTQSLVFTQTHTHTHLHTCAGFKAGTIPPQIMPRIKFAAVEQLCRSVYVTIYNK